MQDEVLRFNLIIIKHYSENSQTAIMLKEKYLHQLLEDLYEKDGLNVYDHGASVFTTEHVIFNSTKSWADQLVRDKLAVYSDAEHTTMRLTNFGKYWMMNGGYESFLMDCESIKDHHKQNDGHKVKEDSQQHIALQKEKEELVAARLKLTHFRLVGFWLTLVISCLGFFLSLFNLYMLLKVNK